MKKKVFTIIFFILYIALIALFTYECLQDSTKAGNQAGNVARIIAKIGSWFTHSEIEITDHFRYMVSKIVGHFLFFVFLGIVSIIFYLLLEKPKLYIRIIMHYAIILIFTFISEFLLEANASGRSPRIADVGIDMAGFVSISTIILIIYVIKKEKKSKE